LGLRVQLALGFILLTCILLLTLEPVKRLILKEGRTINDIKEHFICNVYLWIHVARYHHNILKKVKLTRVNSTLEIVGFLAQQIVLVVT
jgi:hypothetical protein